MCGRFTLATPAAQIAELFDLPVVPDLAPRYNIAPTQDILIVRRTAAGPREIVAAHWGLIPFWAKGREVGTRMINARAETVGSKPAFRSALRSRRCLVPADGFFEWRREGGRKQPYYFTLRGRRPFAFAGLWERWEGDAAGPVESCTVVTTSANVAVVGVHDRMPVILAREAHETWLDTTAGASAAVTDLLRSSPASELCSFPVALAVNDPAADHPGLVLPLAPQSG